MSRQTLVIAMIVLAGIPGPTGAVLAQHRVTSSQVELLRSKVQVQWDAYYKFELAEQEAQDDNAPERAAVYREAKAKAYEAYVSLNAELQKAQMEKREQDRRQAAFKPEN